MSVAIDDTLKEQGLTPDAVLMGHEDFSLAAFFARSAREKGLRIIRKPLPSDLAHGEVVGKKTKSVRNHLMRSSHWYVEPDLPQPTENE